jgi:pyrroline-5-carboxylate reductase
LARRAATIILIGCGRLFESRGENPVSVVETFVRYRGITTAAIEAMRGSGFEEAVAAGLSAAFDRTAKAGDS